MSHLNDQWRDFGVYFAFEEWRAAWGIRGSRDGVRKFCASLRRGGDENVQLGPHRDLLLFRGSPRILVEGIRGEREDFERLASTIERKIERCDPGDEFQIDKQFAAMNTASLYVWLEDDDFDPASCEPL